MKRIAIISDIHSNLEGLEAVFSEFQGEEVYCLGDVVGYGANPNEVIELLKDRGVYALVGNHDRAIETGNTSGFNSRAELAALWTRRHLSESALGFLRGLPTERRVEVDGVRVYLTHGSPDDNLWEYVSPVSHSDLFDHYLQKLEVRVVGLGHTHVPFVWRSNRGVVFNPGSVGQPRNGDRRASYGTIIIDKGLATVELHAVEYDYRGAADKIRAAGLPEQLAARLALGV
jgi:putative phosphoesterase